MLLMYLCLYSNITDWLVTTFGKQGADAAFIFLNAIWDAIEAALGPQYHECLTTAWEVLFT